MGRRSNKGPHAAYEAPGFDTMGMTILPGVSLPTWADPSVPADIEDSTAAEVDEQSAAAAPSATAPSSGAQRSPDQDWASAAATMAAEAANDSPADSGVPQAVADQGLADAPDAMPVMAGSAMMAGAAAAGMAGTGASAEPPPISASGPTPATAAPSSAEALGNEMGGFFGPTYPAAPTAGLGAPPTGLLPPPRPGSAPPGSGHRGQAGMQGPASVAGVAAVTGVAAAAAAGDAATDTVTAPGPADTDDAVADTHPHGVMGHPMVDTPTAGAANASPAPTMPSAEWVADGRPQLSPEHVALLTWWAQMIESGQIPAPPGSDEAPTGNVEPPRRRFPKRAAAIAVVLVAVVALAAALVPRMLAGGEDSAGLPATDVSLPATVGELTAITEPGIGDELEPILNFGLRPAGVTVTAAYGPETAGPLTFAALGTSVAAPADARGLITAWAERTGATMGEPVVGDGPTLGVTCASATASPSVPDGTFCVWASTTARGEAFGIDMSTDQAAGLTAELRDTTTTSAVG